MTSATTGVCVGRESEVFRGTFEASEERTHPDTPPWIPWAECPHEPLIHRLDGVSPHPAGITPGWGECPHESLIHRLDGLTPPLAGGRVKMRL